MGTELIFTLAFAALALTAAFFLTTQAEDKMVLKLAPIGTYNTKAGNSFDLREYFVDTNGNLYSANLDTWEVNHKHGRDILRCSDASMNRNRDIVNSLRDAKGYKATIARKKLNFFELVKKNGHVAVVVTNSTPRHMRVHRLFDSRNPEVKATIFSEVVA